MANNVRATGLNFGVFTGDSQGRSGRLVGTLGAGEFDLRSFFTATNTRQIFAITNTGTPQAFAPGNSFSPLKVLVPGHGYAIVAKQAFEFQYFYPSISATLNQQILMAVRTAASGGSPATNSVYWLAEAGYQWAAEANELWIAEKV